MTPSLSFMRAVRALSTNRDRGLLRWPEVSTTTQKGPAISRQPPELLFVFVEQPPQKRAGQCEEGNEDDRID
jgi:hypothetical protein